MRHSPNCWFVAAAIVATLQFVRVREWRLIVLLMITASELVVAHRSSIVSANRDEWDREPVLIAAVKSHAAEQGSSPFRVHRAIARGTYPESWWTTSSAHSGNGMDCGGIELPWPIGLGYLMVFPSCDPPRRFRLSPSKILSTTGMDSLTRRLSPAANVRYIIGCSKDVAYYPDYDVIARDKLFRRNNLCGVQTGPSESGRGLADRKIRIAAMSFEPRSRTKASVLPTILAIG